LRATNELGGIMPIKYILHNIFEFLVGLLFFCLLFIFVVVFSPIGWVVSIFVAIWELVEDDYYDYEQALEIDK